MWRGVYSGCVGWWGRGVWLSVVCLTRGLGVLTSVEQRRGRRSGGGTMDDCDRGGGDDDEEKIHLMATLLIALRGLSLDQRMVPLSTVTEALLRLPSSTSVPEGIVTPALSTTGGTRRKPLRIGMMVDVALAILLIDGSEEGEVRWR